MNLRYSFILAFSSGLVSGLVFDYTYSSVYHFSKGLLLVPGIPFTVPGIIFGVFLVVMNTGFRKAGPLRVFGVILLSGVAYYCAVYVTYGIFLHDPQSIPVQVLTGGLSGFTGTLLLVVALRIITGITAAPKWMMVTVVAGTLLGCLFMGILILLDHFELGQTWTPSFLFWQFSVLLALDAAFEKVKRDA